MKYKFQLDNLMSPDQINSKSKGKYEAGITHPCSSSYGMPKPAIECDFHDVLYDEYNYNFTMYRGIINLIKTIRSQTKSDTDFNNSFYIDGEGKIRDEIIIEKVEYTDNEGKECICYIVGNPAPGFMLNKSLLQARTSDKNGWGESEHYILELLRKYHPRKSGEGDSDITDLMYDSVLKDVEYIKKNKLLGSEDITKLKEIIRRKLRKLIGEKFKLPNVGLEYVWELVNVKVIKNEEGFNYDIIEPLIYTFRDINGTHKPIFEKLLEMTRTTLLDHYHMPRTNQLLSYVELNVHFRVKTDYLHPLTFLGKKNTFYNRNITLEELIYSCGLTCDGNIEEMKVYEGMPFWAVCPMRYSLMNRGLRSYYVQCYDKIFRPEREAGGGGIVRKRKTKILIGRGRIFRRKLKTKISGGAGENNGHNGNNGNDGNNENDVLAGLTQAASKRQGLSLKLKKSIKLKLRNLDESEITETLYIITETTTQTDANGKKTNIKTNKRGDNTDTDKVFKQVLGHIFNPNAKVVLVFNMYSNHSLFLIRVNVTGEYKFYNVLVQMNNLDREKANSIPDLERNDHYNAFNYYSYKDSLFKILIVKEYDKDDFFSFSIYNISLYREYTGLDTFYKESRIKSEGFDIDNPYKYHIFKLIYLFYSLFFVKNQITKEKLDSTVNGILYSNFKNNDDLTKNDNSNSVNLTKPLNNNVFFVYKSKKYIGFLDRYSGDTIKSKDLKNTHLDQNERHFFKFILWIVSLDTVSDIYTLINKNKDNLNSSILNFIRNEESLKSILYHASSIQTKEQIESIDEILKAVKVFIQEKFKVKESDFDVLNINELSDFQTTSFHIHIDVKSQYFKSLEQINFNKELIKLNTNFFKYASAIQAHFSFTNILDKCKTKPDYFYNRTLNRPFSGGIIKLGGLLCIKDENEDEQFKSVSNV